MKECILRIFFIAGFNYYDGCMALEELKVGTKLELVRDEYNKADVNAIAIYYNDWKLGYVPAQENEMLAKFLDMGYNDVFEIRVQRLLKENIHLIKWELLFILIEIRK